MPVDFAYSDEQRQLAESANSFFRRHCSLEIVREIQAGELGYSPDMWEEMAKLGWLGVSISLENGGNGGGYLDLYPLYEEMGRFLVPSPHLDTVVIAGGLLTDIGSELQRSEILPRIADGSALISLALLELNGGFAPSDIRCSARSDHEGFVVNGTKLLVGFAPSAHHFLCVASTGDDDGIAGVSLFLIDAKATGMSWTRIENMSDSPLYAVVLDNVRISGDSLVGELHGGWEPLTAALIKAAVLQNSSAIGAARAVLEMTNQYAKDRWQFGNPIGKYQAVQYMVTDILIDIHRMDLLNKQAACRIGTGHTFEREASLAIAFGKRSVAHLIRRAHDVFAGIAYMTEHDLHLYSRRATYWEQNLGDVRWYQDLWAKSLGL